MVRWKCGIKVKDSRPRKNLTENVQKDCQACKLNRKDAMNRNRWTKQIKDD